MDFAGASGASRLIQFVKFSTLTICRKNEDHVMVERELASLTLYPDTRLLSAVGDLVSNVAESQGMPSDDALGMAKLTQRVLEYLFSVNLPISDKILIIVTLYLRSGEFSVAIEHKGLPIELNGGSSHSESPFSLSISSPAVDEVNLINLGKAGQKLELIKILPSRVYEENRFVDSGRNMPKNISVSKVPENIEISMIRPDEGLMVLLRVKTRHQSNQPGFR